MKIGLIDVDGHNFPNLVQMKLSAYHKKMGDTVERYEPLLGGEYDRVYMSKVFTFTPDYEYPINADEVVRGGSGYDLTTILPPEIEHIMPDYSLYGITDTAYGFMTRGCPRGCDFCIVGEKEGRRTYTVAPLSEFWSEQKNIVLLDPNPIASVDWKDNMKQLIDSHAYVDFNQGVDIRLMTEEKAEMISRVKVKSIHFAWDRFDDGNIVVPNLIMFKEISGWDRNKISVYVLTNFDTTFKQDLERIYTLRSLGVQPYVMIYDKDKLPKRHDLRRLQRYVNMAAIFWSVQTFEEYAR